MAKTFDRRFTRDAPTMAYFGASSSL